jgi:hypothetical protein
MKTTILFAGILFSIVTSQAQQKEKFTGAMLAALEQSKTAQTQEDLQDLANRFTRIAEAEKNEWTAWYYAAFYNLILNFQEADPGRKEQYISMAQRLIESGMKVKPDETEFLVIRVMSYYAEMAVDPMKGMTLLGEANALLSQAKSINPGNPRIYLEEAEAVYHMPVEFGGGKEKALPLLLLAREKFDKFVPADPLSPDWGKDRCETLLQGTESSN